MRPQEIPQEPAHPNIPPQPDFENKSPGRAETSPRPMDQGSEDDQVNLYDRQLRRTLMQIPDMTEDKLKAMQKIPGGVRREEFAYLMGGQKPEGTDPERLGMLQAAKSDPEGFIKGLEAERMRKLSQDEAALEEARKKIAEAKKNEPVIKDPKVEEFRVSLKDPSMRPDVAAASLADFLDEYTGPDGIKGKGLAREIDRFLNDDPIARAEAENTLRELTTNDDLKIVVSEVLDKVNAERRRQEEAKQASIDRKRRQEAEKPAGFFKRLFGRK